MDALAHYLNFNEIIMAPKYRKNFKQANLSITNKTLKIDHPFVIYQIRNITSVDKRRFRPDYIKNLSMIFSRTFYLLGFLFFEAWISPYLFAYGDIPILSIGLKIIRFIIFIEWLIVLIKELSRMIRRWKYGVVISTNDASAVAIYSRKEDVDEIILRVYEVMENQEENVSYHYRIEGDIIQQSGNFGIGVNQ